jgi:hypothetical protein
MAGYWFVMVLTLMVKGQPPYQQEVAYFRTQDFCAAVARRMTKEEQRRAEEDDHDYVPWYHCEERPATSKNTQRP